MFRSTDLVLDVEVVRFPTCPTKDVQSWFQEYIDAFAEAVRDRLAEGAVRILEFYAVPLVTSRDEGVEILSTESEVLSFISQAIEYLGSDGYSHVEPMEIEVSEVNRTTAIYRGTFLRRRVDGTEMGRFGATYLILDRPLGRRIVATAAHPPIA